MKIYFTHYSFHSLYLFLKFSFTRCNLSRYHTEFTKQSFSNSLFHKANLFQKDFATDLYNFFILEL